MENRKEQLLIRLNEIGKSLESTNKALALIGLGSVGIELERLDEFSDLDFFAIVDKGYKEEFIENLSWLSSIRTITYHFKNTPDGYKLLFDDGIFCEFAVFELEELGNEQFSPGRIIWRKEGINDSICKPQKTTVIRRENTTEWYLGELLTNLYVGLCRNNRGEKLSAMRFIQHYAIDRIIDLSSFIEKENRVYVDKFAFERRYEQRFQSISKHLHKFLQGYEKNKESALEIVKFLEDHFELNSSIKEEIIKLCK